MEKLRLVTGRGLSRILKVDYTTIIRWKEEGKITPIGRLGNCDVYDMKIIEKLKKEQEKKDDKRCVRIGTIINTGTGITIDFSKWFKRR